MTYTRTINGQTNAGDLPIETEAFFWAVTCLSLIKAVDDQGWDGFTARISRDEKLGRISIPNALDEALSVLSDEDDSWLPISASLHFREILADGEARIALDVVENHPHPDGLLRCLLEWFIGRDCFIDAGENPSANVPESVSAVMAGFAKAISDRYGGSPAAIYLPSSCSPTLVRDLQLALPGATVYGQDPGWRNVCAVSALSLLENTQFSFAAGPAIADDAFANRPKSPLAVSVFPHEHTFDVEIADDDPRWMYYTPQRGREEYAWLQQALHHIGDEGFAVLCVPTGMLTTTHVKEFPTRRDLVKEGRVYAAITLPGRLFRSSSVVTHLLVVGPKRPAQADDDCPTLFIDAQEMGQRLDGLFERTMEEGVAKKILDAFHEFIEGGRPREIRFAALAQPADILDRNCSLTADSYVYTPEKITSKDPRVIERGISRLVGEFEEAASVVAELDAELIALLKGVL